jgi:glycosyltransferase involved in cell wall biosynthesis
MKAELFSFCDASELRENPLAIPGAQAVVTVPLPILKQLQYSTRRATTAAEVSFAESSIVSCHSFYRYHAIWVNKMSRKYGVPYWFVPHGVLDPWVMSKGKLVKNAYWQLGGARFLKEAVTVICATKAERDKAAEHFDLPDADVLPWPVELVNVDQREEVRAALRERLGIPNDARVLLYFGRLHPMKQPLETIQALAASRARDIHLIVVGNEDGVSLRDCSEVAKISGVEAQVHFIGPVYGDEKYDYLLASDAYVSLSHRENFNHTAAESMAAGLPVVLSPGNDLLSEIKEVGCFFEMESNSVESAAEAIRRFSETPIKEIPQMGFRGRQWVAEFLSFERFKTQLNALALKHARK